MTVRDREEGDQLSLDFQKHGGLLPVVVQDWESLEVLMQAWTNEKAWEKTLELGKAVFWSRTRGTLWVKGETSGDSLLIVEIRVDCDQDCLLYLVRREGGGVCHTAESSTGKQRGTCFYREFSLMERRLIFKPPYQSL